MYWCIDYMVESSTIFRELTFFNCSSTDCTVKQTCPTWTYFLSSTSPSSTSERAEVGRSGQVEEEWREEGGGRQALTHGWGYAAWLTHFRCWDTEGAGDGRWVRTWPETAGTAVLLASLSSPHTCYTVCPIYLTHTHRHKQNPGLALTHGASQ